MPTKTRRKRRLGKRNQRGGAAAPPPPPKPTRKKLRRPPLPVIEDAESYDDDDDSDEEAVFDLMTRALERGQQQYIKHRIEDEQYERLVRDPLQGRIHELEIQEAQLVDEKRTTPHWSKAKRKEWADLQKKLREAVDHWNHGK